MARTSGNSGNSGNIQVDVIVIGGGPAGLSGALWLARYHHSVALVDSGDPRNWETRGVNGYLGLPSVRPAQLRELGRKECESYGVDLIDGVVLDVERHQVTAVGPDDDGDRFTACLEGGSRVVGQRILLAIGIRDVWPEIPGLERAYGRNAHVCPDCDGYEASGKKVVVIGHGRRAVGMALNLTTWTRDIIICTNGRPPELDLPEYCGKLDALNIPVLTEPIVRVNASRGNIDCLELANGMQLDAEKIFFTIAQYPGDDLGARLGCDRDDNGQIVVDAHGLTSVRHVYAAGDITPGPQLAIKAASQGAIAALGIHKSLVPPARKLEPLGQKHLNAEDAEGAEIHRQ